MKYFTQERWGIHRLANSVVLSVLLALVIDAIAAQAHANKNLNRHRITMVS